MEKVNKMGQGLKHCLVYGVIFVFYFSYAEKYKELSGGILHFIAG